MKNKIAIASAFIAATSFSTAEIVINDFLSFEGFVDMSYVSTDIDNNPVNVNDNASSFAVDQVEISWLFDFDPVTAQIDLTHLGTDNLTNDAGTGVEQAFVTYHMDNGSAVTAGRYASMLGFEAFEPTGLYQYSFAYNMNSVTNIGVGASALPGYYQGVKYTYETDTTFFGLSLADSLTGFGNGVGQLGGNNGESTYAIEAAGSIILAEGVTGFLGAAYEDGETPAGNADNYVINSYVTFETGAWLFAAELNYADYEQGLALGPTNEEVLQALVMANFAYSEQASVTGRLSYSDHEADTNAEADFFKATLAHGYAFTDNLFLVNEISLVDGEVNNADYESLQAAVELIFSF